MSLLSPNLAAFLAITRTQTVHGAARELGITQTGVTQRIRSLEASLSTTLFIRSRKGMQLTHEGQALLRYCQASLDLEGETLAQITGAGEQSNVRVCVTGPSSIMRSRIIPQCIPCLQGFKEVAIEFEINDLESREDALRNGRSQLAILSRERVAREMDSKLLKPEEYVLVGPASWKRRALSDILKKERIIDFDPSDAMTFSYLKKHKLLDQVAGERHFVNSTEALAEMIQAGLGYGVLTAEFAGLFLKRCDLAILNSGAVFEHQVALAWYPRQKMPRYFEALVKAIR
ncbi:MAG: LysR family transcriptional regulator [Bdellovibrionia bacterium]